MTDIRLRALHVRIHPPLDRNALYLFAIGFFGSALLGMIAGGL